MSDKPRSRIRHQDRLLVSEHAPFCGICNCSCHCDERVIRTELLRPLQEGLLTQEEMSRLYTGRQIC